MVFAAQCVRRKIARGVLMFLLFPLCIFSRRKPERTGRRKLSFSMLRVEKNIRQKSPFSNSSLFALPWAKNILADVKSWPCSYQWFKTIFETCFRPEQIVKPKIQNCTSRRIFFGSLYFYCCKEKRKIYKSEDNCCCCKYNQFGFKKRSVSCFTDLQVKSVKIFVKLYKCLQKLSIEFREPSNIRFLDKLRYLQRRELMQICFLIQSNDTVFVKLISCKLLIATGKVSWNLNLKFAKL